MKQQDAEKMSPEDRKQVKLLYAEIGSLWEKHRAVQGKDLCAEQRWLREIGLRFGRLAAQLAPPGDPLDWWCVWCQRVSIQPRPLESTPRCRYSDCDPRKCLHALRQQLFGPPEIGSGFRYVDGRSWFVIRRDWHPEYPEVAEVGMRYSVPELPPRIQKTH